MKYKLLRNVIVLGGFSVTSGLAWGAAAAKSVEQVYPGLTSGALAKQYAGKANVVFVHVRQETVLAGRYGIRSIPVQVFFDKSGKEVFRHTGFIAQPDIENKLRELGVE